MDTVLRLLLTNAASAALVAGIALLVSRLVRRPALAHALWLLALVKLVTPPLLPLPVLPSWDVVSALATPPSPTFVRMAADTPRPLGSATAAPERRPDAATLDRATTRLSDVRALVVAPAADAASAREARGAHLGRVVAGALATGALAVLILAAFRFARFRRVLAWAEPAPAATVARAVCLAAELGLRRVPPVLVVAARIPPMLWPEPGGPRLLLPRDLLRELSLPELDALLAHELAHVRRRDHWVRLVELAATALFWWYPLTWWARAALRRAEERCCDEWVLRVLPRSAEAYANGLLKSLTFVSAAPAKVPALASGASPLYELELRLKEILMSRPAPRLAPPLRLALLAVAAAGLAVYPIHAREDEPRAAVPPVEAQAPTAEAPAPTPVAPARAKPPARAPAPVVAAIPTVPATAPRTPAPARVPAPARIAFSPLALLPAVAEAPARAPRQPREGQAALDEQRAALDAKRRSLQQQELELSRMELELNAREEQAELRATAASLRAEGKTRQAELCEKQLEMTARQVELQRRQLELHSERLAVEVELEAQERAGRDSFTALDQAGSADARRAAELAVERAEADRQRTEEELEKKHRSMEDQAEALEEEMQRLGVEQEIHAVTEATDAMAESLAAQADALKAALRTTGARPDVEREIKRLEAALAALKVTPRSPGASADKTPAPAPQR